MYEIAKLVSLAPPVINACCCPCLSQQFFSPSFSYSGSCSLLRTLHFSRSPAVPIDKDDMVQIARPRDVVVRKEEKSNTHPYVGLTYRPFMATSLQRCQRTVEEQAAMMF